MRELTAGHDAVLLDFADHDDPPRAVLLAAATLRTAISGGGLPGVADVVPAATTVLVQSGPGVGVDRLGVRRALRADPGDLDAPGSASSHHDSADDPLEIPVRYDGPDLDAVADAAGVDVSTVVGAHRATVWRVQFMGFAPGFGYLVPDDEPGDPALRDALRAVRSTPRREESRPSVPAGAIAIAAGYSAIYPRSSPGGWNLLGQWDTGARDLDLWDVEADPPAVLAPGRTLRFVER